MRLDLIILITLVLASLWTVMTRSLLRSAIGLALASAILTIMMFKLKSPLAAVFELSVCAGLISVLFVSTISLTHPLTQAEAIQHMKARLARFWFLPCLVVIIAAVAIFFNLKLTVKVPSPETISEVRSVMWNQRQVDIMGQIIILLTGVFGVVVLFKERLKK